MDDENFPCLNLVADTESASHTVGSTFIGKIISNKPVEKNVV